MGRRVREGNRRPFIENNKYNENDIRDALPMILYRTDCRLSPQTCGPALGALSARARRRRNLHVITAVYCFTYNGPRKCTCRQRFDKFVSGFRLSIFNCLFFSEHKYEFRVYDVTRVFYNKPTRTQNTLRTKWCTRLSVTKCVTNVLVEKTHASF